MEINPVIIFGSKETGQIALDICNSNDLLVFCLLDDDKKEHKKEYGLVSVLGGTDDEEYLKLIGKKCDAFIAVDNLKERRYIAEMLEEEKKVKPVSIFHKQVVLSESAKLGDGTLINAGSVIGTNAIVGDNCIIQNRVVVEAFAEIQDFVHLCSGVIIGQGAVVEEGAFIGTGAIIVPGIRVGKNSRIGAGSLVAANVKAGKTVFGNPAVEI